MGRLCRPSPILAGHAPAALARRIRGPADELRTPAEQFAKRDMQLEHPRSVFQLMRVHYSRYTPEMVESITGIPRTQFLEIAKIVGECGRPDKVMTVQAPSSSRRQ